ncbi:MAG: LptF/LptG family permease [Flavobacteriales bacterium]
MRITTRHYLAPTNFTLRVLRNLSILLLKSYIGPFIVTFMVAMFIFEMQFIWVYLDELMGKGLDAWVIFKLLFYASARVVNMALPLAILMSSIMTLGALAENNELTAMKSAGVSLVKILRPLIAFSMILSVCAFLFANNVWPVANLKFKTLLINIMKQKPALQLTDGVFYNGIDGISIRAMRNNTETGELHDVLIYDHRAGKRSNRTVIRAEKGIMEQTGDKQYLILTLLNGHTYDEQQDKKTSAFKPQDFKYANVHGSFEKNIIRLDLSSLVFSADNEEQMKKPEELMTVFQLTDAIDSLQSLKDSVSGRLAGSHLKALHLRGNNSAGSTPQSMLFETLNETEKKKAVDLAKQNTTKMQDALQRNEEEMTNMDKRVRKHKIEWHRKFYLAVVCMVLFFVGAPLGAIIRKGGIGLPTLVALGIFIAYILLTMAGESLAKHGFVPAWLGIWMSTAVFLPLSVWLTYKAMREAALFDLDRYTRALQYIARGFRKETTA